MKGPSEYQQHAEWIIPGPPLHRYKPNLKKGNLKPQNCSMQGLQRPVANPATILSLPVLYVWASNGQKRPP
jgi:hypothetical protein